MALSGYKRQPADQTYPGFGPPGTLGGPLLSVRPATPSDRRDKIKLVPANTAGGCRGLSFRPRSGFKGSTGSLVRSHNSLLHSRNSLVHSRNNPQRGSSNWVATSTGTDCTHSARFDLTRGRSLQRRDC